MSIPVVKDFVIIKPISRGAYGKVFLGCKKDYPENIYAIKILSKEKMKQKNLFTQITTERNALAISKSPFIVHLFYSLQTSKHVYLVMEYLIGGDLKSLLHIVGYFDEPDAKLYAIEIILALEYLHGHDIIHRDLKPDNMLISASGHLKLTDFGLSTVCWSKKPSVHDLLTTPSNRAIDCPRTPGQLLSLMADIDIEKENVPHGVRHSYSHIFQRESELERSGQVEKEEAKVERKEEEEEEKFSAEAAAAIALELRNAAEDAHGATPRGSSSTPNRCALWMLQEVFFKGVSLDGIFKHYSDAERAELSTTINKIPREWWMKTSEYSRTSAALTFNPLHFQKDPEELENSFEFKPKRTAAEWPITSRVRFVDQRKEDDLYQNFAVSLGTPRRTPKSVKRAAVRPLLGTPDYLAPELLLDPNSSHGPPVDWWSFGVCLFELLTGVPPFNADTAEEVFRSIVQRDIPWPEGEEALSAAAQEAIEALLALEPSERPVAKEIRAGKLRYFHEAPWDAMDQQKMPFIPQPDSPMDTTYFAARNLETGVKLTFSDAEVDDDFL